MFSDKAVEDAFLEEYPMEDQLEEQEQGNQLAARLKGKQLPENETSPFIPLTAEEINQAKNNERIKGRGEQYERLLKRVDELDSALQKRDKDGFLVGIEDECNLSDIENPSLFVKEYKDGEHWKVVPLTTYITNFVLNLLPALQAMEVPAHHATRDPIMNPADYKEPETNYGFITRYKCYPYRNLNDVQELKEAADEIRQALSLLKAEVAVEIQQSAAVSEDRVNNSGENWNGANNFFSVIPPTNDPILPSPSPSPGKK